MKQIKLSVTRYYSKSVSTTITYLKDLDEGNLQDFLRENIEIKKSINEKFEDAELLLDEENLDYSVIDYSVIDSGQLASFDSWDTTE